MIVEFHVFLFVSQMFEPLRFNHLTLMYKQNFGTMDVEVWTYIVSKSVTEPSWIAPRLKCNIDFACIQIPMYINSFPWDPCFGSFERPTGFSHSMNKKKIKKMEHFMLLNFIYFLVS